MQAASLASAAQIERSRQMVTFSARADRPTADLTQQSDAQSYVPCNFSGWGLQSEDGKNAGKVILSGFTNIGRLNLKSRGWDSA